MCYNTGIGLQCACVLCVPRFCWLQRPRSPVVALEAEAYLFSRFLFSETWRYLGYSVRRLQQPDAVERATINIGRKAVPRLHPDEASSFVLLSTLWSTRQRRCCAVAEIGPRVFLPPASLPSQADTAPFSVFSARRKVANIVDSARGFVVPDC